MRMLMLIALLLLALPGKALAAPLVTALRDGGEPDGADASTRGLVAHARSILRTRTPG